MKNTEIERLKAKIKALKAKIKALKARIEELEGDVFMEKVMRKGADEKAEEWRLKAAEYNSRLRADLRARLEGEQI